jgi:hypothetical protein
MFGQPHPTEDKCLWQALRSKPHPTEDKCLANPIQQRTGAGHAIVMINLILVLKIAKQGGGLMRTFWAWRVVGDSRAGLPKQRVARILCARHSKRRTTNNQTPSNKDECLANPIPYGRMFGMLLFSSALWIMQNLSNPVQEGLSLASPANANLVNPCPRRTKFGKPWF